jgi:hypothetical protein
VKERKTLVAGLLSLSLLIFFSLGCSSISRMLKKAQQDRAQNEQGSNEGDTGSASSMGSSQALVKKSNLFISKCFNNYSINVANSRSRYISWIKDPKAGPTGKESIVYGLYQINGDGADCETAINEAKVTDPAMPELEAAADKFVVALKAVLPLVADAYKYYDQEDYKDDAFAKGKEAHGPLMEAFDNFDAVNKEFAAEIDKVEDNVANVQLEEYKDDPSKKYEYNVVDLSIKSKKIIVYIRDKKYEDMKAEDLQPLIEETEAALNETKNTKSGRPTAGAFLSQADDFVKASKDLMRRIRDKKPFSNFDRNLLGTSGGWMVEGSPDKVINVYNRMVGMRSLG